MFNLSPVTLGVLLTLLGLGIAILTYVLPRLMPRLRTLTKVSPAPPASLSLPAHHEAVLLVQRGGRVTYLNQQAREFFNLWEEDPNLESLARRARPSETFLMLCASEGQARFSLNGRFVEGTSYFASTASGNGSDSQGTMLVSLRRPQLIVESEAFAGSTPTALPVGTSATAAAGDAGPGRSAASVETGVKQPARQAEITNQAFVVFSELAQTMASSLDLEVALRAILESVERLIPSDFYEVNIWDADTEILTPYRLVGLASVDRRLERGTERYRTDQGYSGYLATKQIPLLVKDINTFREARPALDRQRYPFQSFVGIPMLVGGDLVGTLELASLTKENYNENDLDVLNLLSGQASVALKNALLFKQEQQRATELAGLANLAQAVSAIQDPQDLYSRLVDSIAPLVKVEILGFLVYDENRHLLEGQVPFLGIQSNVVELSNEYTFIQPGSPAEKTLQNGETIISTNAPEDQRMEALNLHHLAIAAGIRHAVLAPLATGGHILGYMQVANKHDGTPFDADDLRFLTIIAGQTAPIIENATLVQQARRRAQRSESLRRIASLTSSSATLDEILRFSILDMARLLQADVAALFLLDEARGELRLHRGSTYGISPELMASLERLSIDDKEFPATTTGSKRQFFSNNLPQEEHIPTLYEPVINRLNILSAIDVPLVSRERGLGELMVGSFRANFFSSGDFQTLATAAGQLAAAIEQSTLYSQTDHSLRQRVDQLTALTRVSRELNTTLVLPHLLQRVYDEALRTTRADCGTILLFDLKLIDLSEIKIAPIDPDVAEGVQSTAPDRIRPDILLHFGDSPGATLHDTEKNVLQHNQSLVIEDFETGLVHEGPDQNTEMERDTAFSPAHEGIRSALIVPIAYQGQVAGLIHLHSRESGRFQETEREIVEALAVQAAIALGNAQRYHEQLQRTELLNRRVETLSKLFEVSKVLQAEQPLDQALEAIAYAIQAATPFEVVLISICDPKTRLLQRISGVGLSLANLAELRARSQPWSAVQELLSKEFMIGRSYFIPTEHRPIIPAELHLLTPSAGESVSQEYNWNPQDLLVLPLLDDKEEPLGLISVDSPRNKLRPDRPTIETLEIFGSQAALIIESQYKVRDLRSRVNEMEDELAFARESAEKAQAHLPALLHKDLEQTLSLQHLSQRSQRIKAGLDIAELINRQSSHENVLASLCRETLTQMDFDIVLIAEKDASGLSLTHTLGSIPANVNPKALMGQRNPLRHTLQTGERLLVADLEANEEWQNTPLLRSLDAKSFVCLPIGSLPAGGERTNGGGKEQRDGNQSATQSIVRASLLAISHTLVAPFTADDEQLFTLLTQQTSVALQNLNLVDETSRRLQEVNLLMEFSRRLGSLDLTDILQTLVDSAMSVVPAAQSALVALWDANQGLLVPRVAAGYTNNEGLLAVTYRLGEGLPGQVFEQRQALRLDEVDFARHYNLQPENMLRYRNATGGRLPVSCLAAPIMYGGEENRFGTTGDKTDQEPGLGRSIPLGVLVLDNSQTTAAFSDDDLALVTSLAQQTALTLENARLYLGTEQRSKQLRALTDGAAAITSSLRSEDLVTLLLDQLQTIVPYDTGTLWIRYQEESLRSGQGKVDRMIIRAARGFDDSDQRIGLTVDVNDSQLLSEMITTGKHIWVANILRDARFRPISLDEGDMDSTSAEESATGYERLSWLGVPLIASGKVIGVIALEKTEANFYTPDDIQVATTFAGQAAVGLENAKLFQESVHRAQELDQRSQTLTILNHLSSELSSTLETRQILNATIREFAQIIPCSSVSVLLYSEGGEHGDGEGGKRPPGHRYSEEIADLTGQTLEYSDDDSYLTVENAPTGFFTLEAEYSLEKLDQYDNEHPSGKERPGSRPELGTTLPAISLLTRLRETQGIFSTDDTSQESELQPIKEFLARYNTRSLLIVPIASGVSTNNKDAQRAKEMLQEIAPEQYFYGMLLAHNDQPYHYHSEEFDLARTISNQLAISLQNARLFEETRNLTEELEDRVQQRTAQLVREQQRVETLLRIITELSASLDLTQVLQRTLQVLNEYVDAEQITIMISRLGESKLFRLAAIGYPSDVEPVDTPTALKIDEGLAGWIISERQSVLVEDVMEDERWLNLTYEEGEKPDFGPHRSALGVPLMSGAEALGCLLLFHSKIGHFSIDQLDLVQAAANQVAVSVNNAELYRLIREQAEELGTMLRSQQIETSRSKAILEAVADGVLVTDASRQITLFNESAERILELNRSQVLGKSLEQFIGLFGRAAHSWMDTITKWSHDPASHQPGDIYAEQFTLEDGRVILVHLAPVSLKNDFLGTVSIFQDITHQVEVDRLKSEFVATVSHELRTPMTSIKGYVEILLMGAAGQMSDQQSQFLQVVKTNTERLSVLVNDLLDISQIEAGRVAISFQPVHLEEIIDIVIDQILHKSADEGKPVHIEKNIQPNLPRVFGDPDRIRNILENLVDNAYLYNTPDGKIFINMEQVNGEVQVDVKDTGLGIHPDDLSKIFERFFRGEQPLVLGVSGTGLGLSIVKNLVEMHKGRIWAESQGVPGEGSTFSFTLPNYKPEE